MTAEEFDVALLDLVTEADEEGGLTEVRQLVAKGVLLMANRYSDDHVELVIRPVSPSSAVRSR